MRLAKNNSYYKTEFTVVYNITNLCLLIPKFSMQDFSCKWENFNNLCTRLRKRPFTEVTRIEETFFEYLQHFGVLRENLKYSK